MHGVTGDLYARRGETIQFQATIVDEEGAGHAWVRDGIEIIRHTPGNLTYVLWQYKDRVDLASDDSLIMRNVTENDIGVYKEAFKLEHYTYYKDHYLKIVGEYTFC